jgi:nitric oxide reductase subunit C
MSIRPIHIFLFLCLAFVFYSLSIYLAPGRSKPSVHNSPEVLEGQIVWQKYNCQSCHQLYGLGGHLGPDLTNVYSTEGKGELFIRAFVRSGTKQMPSFDLSREEEANLIAFLKSTDASGSADPRSFQVNPTGMIEKK